MNEICDIGSGAPNIALVVSVLKSIYSPLRIFPRCVVLPEVGMVYGYQLLLVIL